MPRSDKFANPFYMLLVVVGLSFVITATAYGVMAVRAVQAATTESPAAEHPLMTWMNRHGNTALLVELALLGACTFGAIGTDEYWQRRAAQSKSQSQ